MRTILIVEDEQVLRASVAELLEGEGYEVIQTPDGKAAHEVLITRAVDLVLTDIRMPEMDGMTLLGHVRQIAPQTPVIMMTAYGTVDSAVAALRAGAWDYLLKPVQFDELLLKIERTIAFGEVSRQRDTAIDQIATESSFHKIVSDAPNMRKLFESARTLSGVKSNVLIVGESGTGKELFARAIHYNGISRDKPFVAVNCGAIPESLLESELFGHRKGSFTGAIRDKIGFFEAANEGTLFLDELSTLPLAVQSSLLRVLEERVVVPVGDTEPRPVDLRVIGASNRNLEEMVAGGDFREDLYYRLNVVQLVLPPLRHRKTDVPLLVHHFIERFADQMNRHILGVTNGAMRAMLSHSWPGNVRELQNVIERAVIFADGREIGVNDLPFANDESTDDVGDDLREALRQFERQHIMSSIRRNQYDKAASAQQLGIGVSSLYRKLDELDIPKNLEEQDIARREGR